jgi:hypothetical protein
MSLLREFFIRRRRAGLVDLITPNRTAAGIAGYTLEWAANFDGAFAAVFTNRTGFLDDNPTTGIPQAVLDPAPGQNHRFVFNPLTFSIVDAGQFWLRLKQLNPAGATVATSPPVLVLPESERHTRTRIIIAGTAPSGATVASSLQLYLPGGVTNLVVQNQEAATHMFIATNVLGPETELAPDALPEFTTYDGVVEQLLVRGAGATAAFSAHFVMAYPV